MGPKKELQKRLPFSLSFLLWIHCSFLSSSYLYLVLSLPLLYRPFCCLSFQFKDTKKGHEESARNCSQFLSHLPFLLTLSPFPPHLHFFIPSPSFVFLPFFPCSTPPFSRYSFLTLRYSSVAIRSRLDTLIPCPINIMGTFTNTHDQDFHIPLKWSRGEHTFYLFCTANVAASNQSG